MSERVELKASEYNIYVPLRGGKRLVFNSVSHKMLLLEDDEEIAPDGPVALAQNGFLVDARHDDFAQAERSFTAKRADPRRLMITIAPTLHCNLACGYCFQGMNKPTQKMSSLVQEGIISQIVKRGSELKHVSVCWYGGEPLMNQAAIWDLSDKLIETCSTLNIVYAASIVTNGFLLTADVATRLTEKRVQMAQVTVDGPEEIHNEMRPLLSGRGSYARIVDNLVDVLANTSLRISMRVNVDTRSADAVWRLMDELSDRGIDERKRFSIYFAPIEAITSSCEDGDTYTMGKLEYARLEISLVERALALGIASVGHYPRNMGVCQAVRNGDMVILPTGDLHKCWDTVQDQDKRHATVWDDVIDEQDSRWMNWSPYKSDVCRSCKILPICGGGCAFKSVHSEETSGEAGGLPCPSLKFNLAERLFLSARHSGLLTEADWDPEVSPTWTRAGGKLGPRHSPESVRALAAQL